MSGKQARAAAQPAAAGEGALAGAVVNLLVHSAAESSIAAPSRQSALINQQWTVVAVKCLSAQR